MEAVEERRLVRARRKGTEVHVGGSLAVAAAGQSRDTQLAKENQAVRCSGDTHEHEIIGREAGQLLVTQLALKN